MILCEATGVGDRRPDSYEYHLKATEAGELAAKARADLILTHVSPTVDSKQVVAEAEASYGRVPTLARPDLRVEI